MTQKYKQNSTTLSKQSSNMPGTLLFNIESSVTIVFFIFFFVLEEVFLGFVQ